MTLIDLLKTVEPNARIERQSTGLKLLVMKHRFFVEKFSRIMGYGLSPADILATDWRLSQ